MTRRRRLASAEKPPREQRRAPRRCGRRRGVVTGHVDGVTGGRNLSWAPPRVEQRHARDAAAVTEKRRRRAYEAEIRELDIKVVERRLQQQILGLEVAVHDAPVVQVRERVQQYANQPPRVHLVIKGLLDDPFKQLAALHELDGHVVVPLFVEEVV